MTIPETVRHEDLIAALQPLLDLLGVTANNVHSDLHIGADAISFAVAARRSGDDAERSDGVGSVAGLKAPPRQFSELYWPVTVCVV